MTKMFGRFMALGGSLVLAAAALAVVSAAGSAVVARAAPDSAAFFVTTGGAGSCAQASPCQLQTALGLAGTGDTLYVAQGTYHGSGAAVITLTHSIKLLGGWSGDPVGLPLVNPRAYPTTVDGQGDRRGVYVGSGLTTTIAGFIVTRGNANGLFADCLAELAKGCGGGMFVDHAAADIENNTFISNTALVTAISASIGHGGGLYLEAASGSVISHNVFMSNTAAVAVVHVQGIGGGLEIYGVNTNTVVVDNNQFIGNLGAYWGGGLALEQASGLDIQGNLFQDNTAISGGGLYTWYCNAEILNNTFRGNTGDGAAYLGFFTGPFGNNLVVDNPSNAGVVVAYGTGGVLAILYNNMVGPSAAVGVDAYANPPSPLNLIFIHNTLVGSGTGTGLLVGGSTVTVTAVNTLVSGFSTGILSQHPASVTLNANYTLFDTNVGAVGNAAFTNNVFGAAALVDPAKGDYHILANSAARDTGVSTFVTTDFDGDPRPIGPRPDIGADETRFVQAVFLPLARK